jgi:hypothetical protein
MSNFLIYSNRLRQWVPSLGPTQAEDFINDAWRDIREANDQWSFLLAQEYWLAPAGITLQGLGVTQFSSTVTLSYSALLSIANLSNPPITQRQIRIGLQGGPIYEIASTNVLQVSDGDIVATDQTLQCLTSAPFSPGDVGKLIIVAGAGLAGADLQTTIASFTAPNSVELTSPAFTTVVGATVTWGSSLTLARVFTEPTNANTNALLYRIYYSPTTTDFHRLDHLVDPITGYEFGWDIGPIDDLDRMDPQRSSVTEPYQLFLHHFDPVTGLPVYEMWPGPTVQRAYTATIWRLGLPFVNDEDRLPPQIPEELLMMRARILAYEWAGVNDADPKRRQTYLSQMAYVKSKYSTEGQPGRPLGLLDQTMRRDEDVALIQGRSRPRRPGPSWPIDSNFLQRHAFPSWWGG